MDAVGAATWIVQVVLEKLVGDGIDAAWAAAASGSDADPSSDVRRLRSRLQSLHLVLSAAQERVPRARGEALLSSLRRLRSLAGDADNLLDEMLYYQIHRQLHPDQASDSCSSISAVQSAISKIRGATAKRARLGDNDTTGRIKEILEQMCEAGNDVREAIKLEKLDAFVDLGCHDAYVHPRGQTTSFITELKVFGRDTVKKRIVAMLTSKEACDVHLSVLPIVGNGGIGKTTLAQLVYNDAVVQDHFSKRIWISVSIHFDEVRLTREMLECLSDGVSKHDEIINLNKLQEILEQSVKSKRLLLVLDDMWEDNDKSRWEKLLAPLRCSLLKGSVILVTTRNHSVVKMIATMDPIHLDGLEDDDFWLLFKSCVFGDEKYEGHWNLQIIGQNIAKRLKGYPLAAKSVGALLKRSLDGGQWMEILQSDEWKLQQGPDDIIPALKVSYIHLPFHLQRCFSYCALFLVAPGMKNPSFPNCIAGLSKLQYLNIHGSSQVSPRPASLGKLRHLMYLDLSGCSEIVELPKRSLENPKNLVHLELSTCSGLVRISEALCYLTKLQYLNLSSCSNLERLPQDVGNLTELQYLYLSGCHKIDALPESIGKLINLVHLDLSRCSFVMPEALGDLTKLKYLSLSGVLDYDRKAEETIDNISTLANLEHLDLSWNYFRSLPKSIGDLKCLHTLDLSGCRELSYLPDSIGSIDSLELLLVDQCSVQLKEHIRRWRSELKCNPLVHFVVRHNEDGSGSNLHQLEDKNPSELEISCLEALTV